MPQLVSGSFAGSNQIRLMLLLVATAALLAVVPLARAYDTFPGDEWMLLQLRELRGGWLDDAALVISGIGEAGIGLGVALPWIPAVAVAGMLAARRWTDAVFLASAATAPAVNLGLKELVVRPRPDSALALVEVSGYGFPSGHSVFAAAIFGALIILVNDWEALDERPALRRAVQATLGLLIVGVGASRVWLGVHWPSDVMGGFLFAALYLAVLAVVRRTAESRK